METSPIDLHFLGEASDGDHEAMMEIVRTAHTDMKLQLDALAQALRSGDLAVIKNAAHKVKGSSAMIGAHGLKAVCQQIEAAANAGTSDPLAELWRKCEAEAKLVMSALAASR